MSKFIKIPFGEKGKHHGFFVLNVELIKHMEYVEVNDAIPKSHVVEQVPYLLIYYGEGRQTFIFNEEEAKILFEQIGV